MTRENDIHDKYKAEIIKLLNNLGFNCVDFEQQNPKEDGKIPDLYETNCDLLIEVKILLLNDNLKKEQNIVQNKLNNKEVASFWFSNTPNFRNDLDHCRRKFRNYQGKKTMVVYVNLMGHQEQSIEELLSGDEYYKFGYTSSGPQVIESGHKGREVREDKNKEIGAIAEYFPLENRLNIVHNTFADISRKISYDIFRSKSKITQREYSYKDRENVFTDIE